MVFKSWILNVCSLNTFEFTVKKSISGGLHDDFFVSLVAASEEFSTSLAARIEFPVQKATSIFVEERAGSRGEIKKGAFQVHPWFDSVLHKSKIGLSDVTRT